MFCYLKLHSGPRLEPHDGHPGHSPLSSAFLPMSAWQKHWLWTFRGQFVVHSECLWKVYRIAIKLLHVYRSWDKDIKFTYLCSVRCYRSADNEAVDQTAHQVKSGWTRNVLIRESHHSHTHSEVTLKLKTTDFMNILLIKLCVWISINFSRPDKQNKTKSSSMTTKKIM